MYGKIAVDAIEIIGAVSTTGIEPSKNWFADRIRPTSAMSGSKESALRTRIRPNGFFGDDARRDSV